RRFGEPVAIELLANGLYAAIHHVARRDDICAGLRMTERSLSQKLQCRIIQNTSAAALFFNNAAVAVRYILAKADVANEHQFGKSALQLANGLLHKAILRVSAAGLFIFVLRNPEEQHGAPPSGMSPLQVFDE